MNYWELEIITKLRVPFVILIVVCGIYLICQKEEVKRYILGCPTLILFAIFNPFVVDILVEKFGFANRIERFFWYTPFITITIVAIVDFLFEKRRDIVKAIGFLIIMIMLLPIGLHTMEFWNDGNSRMYRMKGDEIEIARILEGEGNNDQFTVWSDCINLNNLHQYLPQLRSCWIDGYMVAEDKTYEQLYGERYWAYLVLIGLTEATDEEFVNALDEFEVCYYILSKNSSYGFLLNYHECSLIASVDSIINIYRVEDMIK